MQFLLTEAEYKEMSDRPSRECFNKAADERQALCIKLAMETLKYCNAVPGTTRNNPCAYCDKCPAVDFCTSSYREFSK